MKIYSIGRDNNCNIVIDDNSDVISRRHATLNVSSSGKMTIVDQSHNGTYVNGIRIASNVPVPVTRKDNVSFAHVARLDWNQIPKPFSPLTWAAAALVAALAILAIVFAVKAMNSCDNGGNKVTPVPEQTKQEKEEKGVTFTPEQVQKMQDSIKNEALKQAKDENEKKRVQDSIDAETAKKVAQARADSIERARQDSIAKANRKRTNTGGGPVIRKPNPPKPPTPPVDPPKPKRF